MKKVIAILAVMMFAILAIVPMTGACAEATAVEVDASNAYTMYVSSSNGKGVRMREDWNTDSKILFNLGEGRPVTVTAENEGWSEVRVEVNGKFYNGYIMSKFLSKQNPANLKQSFKAVKPFQVKVRTATRQGIVSMWNTTAKRNVNKIRDLAKTEKLTVVEESRAWYKVMDVNGTEGFVAKAYVA